MNIQESLNRIDEKKKKLDAYRPLPPELVQNLSEWFAIEFTYTSNVIEGNTLSMAETAMVVEKGITVGGKTIREHLEATNHAEAIDFIKQLAQKKQSQLALEDILNPIFAITPIGYPAGGIEPKLGAEAREKMLEYIMWLQTAEEHPVIIAALAHYKLAKINLLIDDNGVPFEALAKEGRTARLLMNLLLLQQGYPLAIIKKEKRAAYIAAIESARQQNDMTAFYAVIIDALEYVLDAYLEAVEQV